MLANALSHPARVRILRFLMSQESCFAGAVVEHLPLAQSTVSQHLKVLRDAGLIRGEVEGLHICYCADEVRLQRVTELLGGLGTADAVSSLFSAEPSTPVGAP
jgi:ArsR family transcriptional regulator